MCIARQDGHAHAAGCCPSKPNLPEVQHVENVILANGSTSEAHTGGAILGILSAKMHKLKLKW